MLDMTLLSMLMDEKNDDNIILFDDSGESVELEQVAVIPHEDELYAILRPLDADEDSAAVFKIDPEDEESLVNIEDDALASKILDIYNDSAGV